MFSLNESLTPDWQMMCNVPAGNFSRFKYLLSSAASPKFWQGSIILTLSKQQHFVWDTASQSTKRQDTLEILGPWPSFPLSWLRLCYSCKESNENARVGSSKHFLLFSDVQFSLLASYVWRVTSHPLTTAQTTRDWYTEHESNSLLGTWCRSSRPRKLDRSLDSFPL